MNTEKKRTKLTFAEFLRYVSLIFLLVIVAGWVTNKSSQYHIKEEYSNYKNIVRNAKLGRDLIYQGTITDFEKKGDDYYLFFVIIKEDNNPHKVKSPISYSEKECNYYMSNPDVLVAKDKASETYILMDFADVRIEEYKEYKESHKAENIFSNLAVGLSVILILTFVFSKKNKSLIDLFKSSHSNKNKTDKVENEINTEYCDYCGSKISQSSRKCHNCGASINRKKEI